MLADFLWAALGLGLLVLAGDSLVKGAVNLALRAGIPALVVGLTIVAFGTSAPELLVSVQAVLKDAPGIALGNVVGSNTANILLVLGIPALISTIRAGQTDIRRSYTMMLAASALFIGLCFTGPILRWQAAVLLGGLALMLFDNYLHTRNHQAAVANGDAAAAEVEGADPSMPGWRIAVYLVLGLIGLPIGADLLVDSSVDIARAFGVSETVIGLTLVAVGTSLPELATSVIAAFRRHAEMALGNVIGSNMFNLLGIVGVAGLVGPLPIPEQLLRADLWVMLAASLVIAPVVYLRWNLGRMAGFGLTVAYATYLLFLVL
ncbi:MAG: calcium/sodium antiporter [Gemmobacter sp.]